MVPIRYRTDNSYHRSSISLTQHNQTQETLGSSDHIQMHFNNKIKSDKTKVKHCRRYFRKGNYKEIRKRLAHIDGKDKMKNKRATECWTILRSEVDSAIDRYVPGQFRVQVNQQASFINCFNCGK